MNSVNTGIPKNYQSNHLRNTVLDIKQHTLYTDQHMDLYSKRNQPDLYHYTTEPSTVTTLIVQQKRATTSTISGTIYETISITLSSTQSTSSSLTSNTTVTNNTGLISNTDGTLLNNLADQNGDDKWNAKIIGLSIGLPLGLFLLGVLGALFFYTRNKRGNKNSFNSGSDKWHYTTSGKYLEKYSGGNNSSNILNRELEDGEINYKFINKLPIHNIAPHVLTPKDIAYNPDTRLLSRYFSNNNYSNSINSDKEIEAYLYKKPPNLEKISSDMHPNHLYSGYFNNSSTNCLSSSPPPKARSNKFKNSIWNYESPLSKWFLTKSTYLQDHGNATSNNLQRQTLKISTPLKTAASATIGLKQLNILTRRLDREKTGQKDLIVDEKSPILSSNHRDERNYSDVSKDKSLNCNLYETWNPYKTDMKSGTGPTLRYSTSLSSNDIKPQHIIENTVSSQLEPINDIIKKDGIADDNKSNIFRLSIPINKKRKKKLKDVNKHLIEIENTKPLPILPSRINKADKLNRATFRKSTALELQQTYVVTRNYEPKLSDELRISVGECLKVLATHTDGWCLVEKIGRHGYNSTQDVDIDGDNYLNEYRGIVPILCLKKL
ncbi:uncharacterized protein SCODWIG_00707 [Saccharomycodes ludwigii]|uniref:SH3 domain-containing protein n=1 Tax=Saccharomycodes ludwigii TaxID=36035 RepID=A0A376B2N3_9ASCO|nr:hypothetical protein SCDLUD_003857 [Saccharomycodes ludwigii]KAH3899577.1 hypothetical protein SCDLUD_003857 [Saccharomycodes ludwigii]SSD58946.1 uncharacterized protein SCODWIG_00707 [Saccharomycodes ludwigii]